MINFSDIQNLESDSEIQAFAALFVYTFMVVEPIKQGISIVLGCDNIRFEGKKTGVNDLYKVVFKVGGLSYYEIEFFDMYGNNSNFEVNSNGLDLDNVYKKAVDWAANRISVEIEQREYYRNLHKHN